MLVYVQEDFVYLVCDYAYPKFNILCFMNFSILKHPISPNVMLLIDFEPILRRYLQYWLRNISMFSILEKSHIALPCNSIGSMHVSKRCRCKSTGNSNFQALAIILKLARLAWIIC